MLKERQGIAFYEDDGDEVEEDARTTVVLLFVAMLALLIFIGVVMCNRQYDAFVQSANATISL